MIKHEVDDATLHLAFATFPNGISQEDYIKNIEKIYSDSKGHTLSNFKKEESDFTHFYIPKKYLIFGGYDICFVTLVGSHKFSQSIFDNHSLTTEKRGYSNSYQVITGSLPKHDTSVEDIYYKVSDKAFYALCNLKLSNPLIIGNGMFFKDEVAQLIFEIAKKYANIEIILLNTYSWFEMSISIFSDNLEDIGSFIKNLRWQQLGHLKSWNKLFDNSLFSGESISDLTKKSPHIFADSHTYAGISYKFIENKGLRLNSNQSEIQSTVEIQTKPGHLALLKGELDKLNIFDLTKKSFLIGKTDFKFPLNNVTNDSKNDFNQNLELNRWVNECGGTFKNFRKIKTKVEFIKKNEIVNYTNESFEIDPKLEYQTLLRENTIWEMDKDQIDKLLTKLQISRTLRLKILKVFFLYNQGCQDPVLFIYMIDFKVFMTTLKERIKRLVEADIPINKCEEILKDFVDVFDEGYALRMYNSYFFDDLSDSIAIDFNSNIQSLVTAYNDIIQILTESIFGKDSFGHIVRINLSSTLSSNNFINYSIDNLYSPELFFSTVLKEVLSRGTNFEKPLNLKLISSKLEEYFKSSNIKLLENVNDENEERLFLEYVTIDIIRFIISYNSNADLYIFYFTKYILQSPELLDKNGQVELARFKHEFRRIFLVLFFFGEHEKLEKCPHISLFSFWQNTYPKIKFEFSKLSQPNNDIKNFINSSLNSWLETNASRTLDNCSLNSCLETNASRTLDNCSLNSCLETNENRILDNFKTILNSPIENIETGVFKNQEENSIVDVLHIMYQYMLLIFVKNNEKIDVVSRDKDGNINVDVDGIPFSSVDPWGGVFFKNFENAKAYLKYRDSILQTILHISYLYKKQKL